MILARELPGGTIIQERKLAASLGISRTPMREALVRLEGEGWLIRLTDRLLSVKVVDLEEFLHALKTDGFSIHRSDDDQGILFHHRRRLADGELLFLGFRLVNARSHHDDSMEVRTTGA